MTKRTRASVAFRRLNAAADVSLRADACLPRHRRVAECDACVAACPVGALHRNDDGLALDDEACLGCGRCMAACDMGALTLPGFDLDDVAGDRRHKLYVDCRRVPADATPEGALRVPCLGGLVISKLLALRLRTGKRPIRLLDRGWCARCPAGRGVRHPARAALERVRALLRETGVPAFLWPDLHAHPLPPSRRAQPFARAAGAPPAPGRRDFLNRPVPRASGAGTADVGSSSPVRSPERARQLALLRRLAARYGRPVPAGFFPTIEIEESCRNHRQCAALCPTGALRGYDVGQESGVRFDASACVACGRCETVCPQEALRLRPQGSGTTPRRVSPALTRHARRVCENCCTEFVAPEDEALCPACRKSHALAHRGVDALFRHRRTD